MTLRLKERLQAGELTRVFCAGQLCHPKLIEMVGQHGGYDAVWLWTHTILESARRIYAGHGFEITDVHVHEEFGEPIQGENWRLDLALPPQSADRHA